MNSIAAIAVLGTFDSKGEEHLFLKKAIEQRGLAALTVNVGTKGRPPLPRTLICAPRRAAAATRP
jgi:uncharacterized protein (UPF0261 family)